MRSNTTDFPIKMDPCRLRQNKPKTQGFGKKDLHTHHGAGDHDHDAGEVGADERRLRRRRLHVRHHVHEEGQRHLNRLG